MDTEARLLRIREVWESGDRLGAARLLADAMQAATTPGERVQVEASRAAFLLAAQVPEESREALASALRALEAPEAEGMPPELRARLRVDLRITAAVLDRDDDAFDAIVDDAIALARDGDAARSTAARAVNNRLAVRLARLERIGTAPGQLAHVDAALAIGQARSLADAIGRRGTVERRAAVAVAVMGDWQRAWEWTHDALEAAETQTERLALATHAAHLAWERGDKAAARTLGDRAWSLANGVSAVWARTTGALGAVIAAAAGSGSVAAALAGYRRSVDAAGHRQTVDRALHAALIALESGAERALVERFALACAGPRDTWPPAWRALLAALDGRAPWRDTAALDAWCDGPAEAWQRAMALRLRAAARLREGDQSGAVADLGAGLRTVARWPGRRRDALERVRDLLRPIRDVTPGQAAVLSLVVEGRTDREIAAVLGRSPRTVESHVRALLRAYEAPNRVALAVAAAREPFLDV